VAAHFSSQDVLLSAVAALLCSCKDSGPPFLDIPPDDGLPALGDRVGVSFQLAWGTAPEQAAARARQLDRLSSLGVRRLRLDFTWHRLEKAPGSWDFSPFDPVVEEASAAGLSLLAIAAYGNPVYPHVSGDATGTQLGTDALSEVHFPPIDPAHYARYVEALVRRYAPRVQDYELWNEENIGCRFFRPVANAEAYAGLARPAAALGKAACPGCRFVVGGLSMPQPIPGIDVYPPGPVYLNALFLAAPDLNGWTDAIAYHPYPFPKDPPEFETAPFPDRKQGSLTTQHTILERIVKGHRGQPAPLWITEMGWPTNPGIPAGDQEIARVFGLGDSRVIDAARSILGEADFRKLLETVRGVSPDDQARFTVRAILIAASLKVPRIYLYTLDDLDAEPEINQEAAFGLFRVDGAEKPAARALRFLLTRLHGYRFAADLRGRLGLEEQSRGLAFREGKNLLFALWRWKDGPASVVVGTLPGTATLFNAQGEILASAKAREAITVPLDADVRFLEIRP
jgi:hypothetical protein